MLNPSKDWHEKMHGHGIWHSHCEFCKTKPPKVRLGKSGGVELTDALVKRLADEAEQGKRIKKREAILTRMNKQAERLGLRQGGPNDALAEAERILAKPKKRSR